MSNKKRLQLRDPFGPLVVCAPCPEDGKCHVHPVSSCCVHCQAVALTAELLERMLNDSLKSPGVSTKMQSSAKMIDTPAL